MTECLIFQCGPVLASTNRGLQIAILVAGLVGAAITAVLTRHWTAWAIPLVMCFFLLMAMRNWFPEPAIDEWVELRKQTRIAMVQAGHPAAIQPACYDRESDVRSL